MNGINTEKQAPHDASNDLLEEKKDYSAQNQDDAASSTYNHSDDVEKAQPHDTTESVGDDGAEKKEEAKETDPNIVDFDGDNDPECALNWTTKKKWTTGSLLSAMTFVTFVLPWTLHAQTAMSTNNIP
jgi:hypothetical protein